MRAGALLLVVAAAAGAQPYFQYPVAGIQPPVAMSKVQPEYTRQAKNAGIEGTVLVYAEIGKDGRAHRMRVLKGLGYGLDARAIDAVGQWRFRPGTKNGLRVATPATIEVKFRLADVAASPARV